MTIRIKLKRTISVSNGLGLLQMVPELDTKQCVSEDTWASKGVDCEISHRLKRRTKHFLEGCGNLSLTDAI